MEGKKLLSFLPSTKTTYRRYFGAFKSFVLRKQLISVIFITGDRFKCKFFLKGAQIWKSRGGTPSTSPGPEASRSFIYCIATAKEMAMCNE